MSVLTVASRTGAVPALHSPQRLAWRAAGSAVAVLAFVSRLLPVLRGGGLYGLGDYDDGVHYSAAAGLVHGRLPYRDFLFLHPPGIVLALTPFALLGRLLGDPTGFAVARLSWMALGGANALLVMRILRRRGRAAALVAGLFYALFPPAVYGEHSTQLEGLATTCMLVAILLLSRTRQPRWWPAAIAGALLGCATGIKIWGVAAVAIAVVWAALDGSRRRAVAIAAGAAAGSAVVCLPFFLAAPATMYRMVVQDQLGRPPMNASPFVRLSQIVGLPGRIETVTPLLAAVLVLFVAVAVLAAVDPQARLAVALLVGLVVMLMVTPSWFVHYAALIAGPAAVTVGSGVAVAMTYARRLSGRLGVVTTVAFALLVTGYAIPMATTHFGSSFPGSRLAAAAQQEPGCVTTDDPTSLIEMNVLGRNLDRGCPLVIDLGGLSYDEPGSTPVSRNRNNGWQHAALTYLHSGSVVVVARFSAGKGFSRSTAQLVRRWPLLLRVGRYSVRGASGQA